MNQEPVTTRCVVASTLTLGREAFSTLGEVTILDPQEISAKKLGDAKILALRSTTKVNRELLEGSRVGFVGTATIGTDHMDIPYLEQSGIKWCSAAGCNANSVAEYLVSALLCLGNRHEITIKGLTIGVIGVGNVGTRVVEKARSLGLNVLTNDPPRQDRGDNEFDWVDLDTLLAGSDIVTIHVPLTREGRYPTAGIADVSFFDRMKRGAIFINAARGSVMNEAAVMSAVDSGKISHAIIDTWGNEPDISMDLLSHAAIGTPHIAGHSYEGKVMGTAMVYREVCRFLGVPEKWVAEEAMEPPTVPSVKLDVNGRAEQEVLWELVRQIYDIETDDRVLRANPSEFYELRKQYPVRREFQFTKVTIRAGSTELKKKVAELGFQLTD